MNKAELINAVAASTGFSKKDAETALEILRANGEDAYIIGEIVESGDKVILE